MPEDGSASRAAEVAGAAERAADTRRVDAADNGRGVDPDEAEHLFEGVERGAAADERAGSGVDLALCKRVVERHGGRIEIDSTPGEGSVSSVHPQAWLRARGLRSIDQKARPESR